MESDLNLNVTLSLMVYSDNSESVDLNCIVEDLFRMKTSALEYQKGTLAVGV